MIGKIRPQANGFRGLLGYLLQRPADTADVLDASVNLRGWEDSPREVAASAAVEFRSVLVGLPENSVRKPLLHIIGSWSPEEELSNYAMRTCSLELMESIGIDPANHPFAVIRHNDAQPHAHIVVSTVGYDGFQWKNRNKPHEKMRERVEDLERRFGFVMTGQNVDEQQLNPSLDHQQLGDSGLDNDAFAIGTITIGGGVRPAHDIAPHYLMNSDVDNRLNHMERRTGLKAYRRLAHAALREAIQHSDGTLVGLADTLEERAQLDPTFMTNHNGFCGCSFTLLTPDKSGTPLLDADGHSYTFSGQQIGWPAQQIQRALDARTIELQIAQRADPARRQVQSTPQPGPVPTSESNDPASDIWDRVREIRRQIADARREALRPRRTIPLLSGKANPLRKHSKYAMDPISRDARRRLLATPGARLYQNRQPGRQSASKRRLLQRYQQRRHLQ